MGSSRSIRSMLRAAGLLSAGLLLLTAGCALASPARAESTSPAEFSFGFDTTQTSASANAELYILYKDPENPDDPDGRSPALTEVIIAAPPGTVFDGAAVPACEASDAELMLLGQAACPEASRVGGGFGSVVTTAGQPNEFVAEVTLFNYGEGIIELLEFLDGGFRAVDRARFEGASTMVLHPAVVPGFTEREFSFIYEGMPGGSGSAFITTPPDCPPNGGWTSRLAYTVTTGATYSVSSTMPCAPTATSQPAVLHPSPGAGVARQPAGKGRKRKRCKRAEGKGERRADTAETTKNRSKKARCRRAKRR
jgi:hypothetical protein